MTYPEQSNVSDLVGIVPSAKPCPFCGRVPDVNDPASFTQEIQPKWGAVVCCITGPEVRTGYEKWPAWRDAAVRAWNERHVRTEERKPFAFGGDDA